ncbi:MAG: PEP-CTERM sorting domain-containing protein [Chthoniobacterales bacterium]
MKTLLFGIAAALLSLPSLTNAGTLTIHDGAPSFLPESSFTDNDITAVLLHNPPGVMGDVVRLLGDSQVAPAAESPRILIGGDFSANAGDLFSVIYDFTVNLATPDPITLTIGAATIVDGVQQIFNTVLTVTPGVGHYQGQIDGPLFTLATSGLWKGRLFFNFTTADGATNPNPGGLLVKLRAVDFQLASVPEPSSYVFLGMGIAALGFVALRRRQAA